MANDSERLDVAAQLRNFVRVLREQKWLIIVAVLAATGAAYAYAAHQRKEYQTDAKILFQQDNLGSLLNGQGPGIIDPIRQSHAAFAFLLDYVPNWKLAYQPGGLIQYQSFIPTESALEVFTEQLDLCRRAGNIPYLGVFKRHREDDFLMTHAVNGYSLALDFKVTASNRARLWQLCAEMDKLVIEAGGRFYFAKDSTLTPESFAPCLAEERVRRFLAIKRACDPEGLLETDLFRRIFRDVQGARYHQVREPAQLLYVGRRALGLDVNG